MVNLLDNNLMALTEICAKYNQKPYRANQLLEGLYSGAEFSEITNLPKDFLLQLQSDGYTAQSVNIQKVFASNLDKTQKFLLKLCDGNLIESVFLPNNYGNTICVSTQVGCNMGCVFCASGIGGKVRNLTSGEILGQVVAINKYAGGTLKKRAIANIVLMGSGEPLDNYTNTVNFINNITASYGLNFSMRSISLSTCGIVPKIRQLADDGLNVTLSISLHATTDETRMQLMPIAKTYNIAQIVDAAKYYYQKTGRRILFEYTLIKGVNTNHFDAKRLSEICANMPSHVNLIMLNGIGAGNLKGSNHDEAVRFCSKLSEFNVSATIRRSLGSDIAGACGQLRNQYVGTKPPVSSGQKPK